jgi:hypothetical protein
VCRPTPEAPSTPQRPTGPGLTAQASIAWWPSSETGKARLPRLPPRQSRTVAVRARLWGSMPTTPGPSGANEAFALALGLAGALALAATAHRLLAVGALGLPRAGAGCSDLVSTCSLTGAALVALPANARCAFAKAARAAARPLAAATSCTLPCWLLTSLATRAPPYGVTCNGAGPHIPVELSTLLLSEAGLCTAGRGRHFESKTPAPARSGSTMSQPPAKPQRLARRLSQLSPAPLPPPATMPTSSRTAPRATLLGTGLLTSGLPVGHHGPGRRRR